MSIRIQYAYALDYVISMNKHCQWPQSGSRVFLLPEDGLVWHATAAT